MYLTEQAIKRSVESSYNDTPESVVKPIGDLAKIIANISPGDLLLFMIALDKENKNEKNLSM